jgi:hypothetical protein
MHSGKVIDLKNGEKQAQFQQWDNEANKNQVLEMLDDEIKLKSTTLCFDCSHGKKDPGTTVIGWPHNGGANQQWELVKVADVKVIKKMKTKKEIVIETKSEEKVEESIKFCSRGKM